MPCVDAPADNSVSHRLHPFWLALHTEHGVEERVLLRGELCNAVFIVLHWAASLASRAIECSASI